MKRLGFGERSFTGYLLVLGLGLGVLFQLGAGCSGKEAGESGEDPAPSCSAADAGSLSCPCLDGGCQTGGQCVEDVCVEDGGGPTPEVECTYPDFPEACKTEHGPDFTCQPDGTCVQCSAGMVGCACVGSGSDLAKRYCLEGQGTCLAASTSTNYEDAYCGWCLAGTEFCQCMVDGDRECADGLECVERGEGSLCLSTECIEAESNFGGGANCTCAGVDCTDESSVCWKDFCRDCPGSVLGCPCTSANRCSKSDGLLCEDAEAGVRRCARASTCAELDCDENVICCDSTNASSDDCSSVAAGEQVKCLSGCGGGWETADDGSCSDCLAGYYGSDCQGECPGGFETPCNSHGDCADGLTGSGTCTCNEAFDGSECDECAPGLAGPACTVKCDGGKDNPCNNNGICDSGVSGDGTCTCNPGFLGDDCDECASGYYGSGSSCQECPGGADNPCGSKGECNSDTGVCECVSGFSGTLCDTECDICGEHGQCKADDSSKCDCHPGWEGDLCDQCGAGTQPSGGTCEDIDECEVNNGSCGGPSRVACVNNEVTAKAAVCTCLNADNGHWDRLVNCTESDEYVCQNANDFECRSVEGGSPITTGNCSLNGAKCRATDSFVCRNPLDQTIVSGVSCSASGDNCGAGDVGICVGTPGLCHPVYIDGASCDQAKAEAKELCFDPASDENSQNRATGYCVPKVISGVECSVAGESCQGGTCREESFDCSTCAEGYFGAYCHRECPGGATLPCSGHGVCNQGLAGDGKCGCTEGTGWSGDDCGDCADGWEDDSNGTACAQDIDECISCLQLVCMHKVDKKIVSGVSCSQEGTKCGEDDVGKCEVGDQKIKGATCDTLDNTCSVGDRKGVCKAPCVNGTCTTPEVADYYCTCTLNASGRPFAVGKNCDIEASDNPGGFTLNSGTGYYEGALDYDVGNPTPGAGNGCSSSSNGSPDVFVPDDKGAGECVSVEKCSSYKDCKVAGTYCTQPYKNSFECKYKDGVVVTEELPTPCEDEGAECGSSTRADVGGAHCSSLAYCLPKHPGMREDQKVLNDKLLTIKLNDPSLTKDITDTTGPLFRLREHAGNTIFEWERLKKSAISDQTLAGGKLRCSSSSIGAGSKPAGLTCQKNGEEDSGASCAGSDLNDSCGAEGYTCRGAFKEGLTGEIWPVTRADGKPVCLTNALYYLEAATGSAAIKCDTDGDGWIRTTAYSNMINKDMSIRANARCADLMTVTDWYLVNELGQRLRVDAADVNQQNQPVIVPPWVCPPKEGKGYETCVPFIETPFLDSDNTTSGSGLDGGSEERKAYTWSGGDSWTFGDVDDDDLDGKFQNPLQKACTSNLDTGLGDYNKNGLEDYAENQGGNGAWSGTGRFEPIYKELQSYTYFGELYKAGYEILEGEDCDGASSCATPNAFSIEERPRCEIAGAISGVPLSFGTEDSVEDDGHWRSCLRAPGEVSVEPEDSNGQTSMAMAVSAAPGDLKGYDFSGYYWGKPTGSLHGNSDSAHIPPVASKRNWVAPVIAWTPPSIGIGEIRKGTGDKPPYVNAGKVGFNGGRCSGLNEAGYRAGAYNGQSGWYDWGEGWSDQRDYLSKLAAQRFEKASNGKMGAVTTCALLPEADCRWRGMNHFSQFQCVKLGENKWNIGKMKSAEYNYVFNECKMNTACFNNHDETAGGCVECRQLTFEGESLESGTCIGGADCPKGDKVTGNEGKVGFVAIGYEFLNRQKCDGADKFFCPGANENGSGNRADIPLDLRGCVAEEFYEDELCPDNGNFEDVSGNAPNRRAMVRGLSLSKYGKISCYKEAVCGDAFLDAGEACDYKLDGPDGEDLNWKKTCAGARGGEESDPAVMCQCYATSLSSSHASPEEIVHGGAAKTVMGSKQGSEINGHNFKGNYLVGLNKYQSLWYKLKLEDFEEGHDDGCAPAETPADGGGGNCSPADDLAAEGKYECPDVSACGKRRKMKLNIGIRDQDKAAGYRIKVHKERPEIESDPSGAYKCREGGTDNITNDSPDDVPETAIDEYHKWSFADRKPTAPDGKKYYYPAYYSGHNKRQKTDEREKDKTKYPCIDFLLGTICMTSADNKGDMSECIGRPGCKKNTDAVDVSKENGNWRGEQFSIEEYNKPANGDDGALYIQVYKKDPDIHQCHKVELKVETVANQ